MMLSYEECKKIALDKAKLYNTTMDTAYEIGNDFAFENSKEAWEGVFPCVVIAESGETMGLWRYLNDMDLTEYDMKEREF